MKSVLISIQPKWCEKIANGEKTIEVRKSAPKEVPFRVFIYATKREHLLCMFRKGEYIFSDDHSAGKFNENIFVKDKYDWQGKVIGEFVCDKVDTYCYRDFGYEISEETFNKTMLTGDEFCGYGKGKPLYGWHISNLKIYDKPKALSEFISPSKAKNCVDYCLNGICSNLGYEELCGAIRRCDYKKLTRPPQSWQYVEVE